MKKFLYITMALSIGLLLIFDARPTTLSAQEVKIACESDVIVQADDWLSKIAEKFFGNVLAFPAIVEATNAKAAEDETYSNIKNPDIIEVGWKLCIPSSTSAQVTLTKLGTVTANGGINEEIAPTPKLVDYNQTEFIWEWEGMDIVENVDWYFDIKIYDTVNAPMPYDTLVANPDETSYLNGKWYSDLKTNFHGCSYWAVQIAKRENGSFVGHISPESDRSRVGQCEGGGSTFSSPINR